jgi:membrane associated rhomboid family serine protease
MVLLFLRKLFTNFNSNFILKTHDIKLWVFFICLLTIFQYLLIGQGFCYYFVMDNKFSFSASVVFLPLFFVLSMWIVFWVDVNFHLNLTEYGIFPRRFSGLLGIFFSPFLHANLEHLANNSFPLLVLLASLRYFYRVQAYKIVIFGILFSGFITWVIGRNSYHIGASSLIYVLVSFVFFKGIQTKYFRLVALSFTILFLYGSLVWYIFPHPELTSSLSILWEGHFAGFLTGLVFTKFFHKNEFHKPLLYDWEKPDFDYTKDDFMKCFDDKGNFIDPVYEDVVSEEVDFKSEIIYYYEYKETLK